MKDKFKIKGYKADFALVREYCKDDFFVLHENDPFYYYSTKGATPLIDDFVPNNFTGLRIIPLNMSESILIVKGSKTTNNLGFAPHGAGRNMSRNQHKKSKLENSTIEDIFKYETEGLDVRFFSGNIDISELPSAYKNANEVKKQIEEFDLCDIVDEIMPYGCIMAGDWKKDKSWKRSKR